MTDQTFIVVRDRIPTEVLNAITGKQAHDAIEKFASDLAEGKHAESLADPKVSNFILQEMPMLAKIGALSVIHETTEKHILAKVADAEEPPSSPFGYRSGGEGPFRSLFDDAPLHKLGLGGLGGDYAALATFAAGVYRIYNGELPGNIDLKLSLKEGEFKGEAKLEGTDGVDANARFSVQKIKRGHRFTFLGESDDGDVQFSYQIRSKPKKGEGKKKEKKAS